MGFHRDYVIMVSWRGGIKGLVVEIMGNLVS